MSSSLVGATFPKYAFEITADVVLGLVLGVSVNIVSNKIAVILKLRNFLKIVVQIFLNIFILYVLKIDSKYLYDTWKGETNYGIVFTSVFLASQRNLVHLFTDIYDEESNNFRNIFVEPDKEKPRTNVAPRLTQQHFKIY